MDFFQEALRIAREEGKIDPGLIPWEKPAPAAGKKKRSITDTIKLSPYLGKLSDQVIDDFKKTIENIRIEAQSRSLHVIGISSAVGGQGTTTFTAILALMMAAIEQTNLSQVNEKDIKAIMGGDVPKPGVLLIDAQLRFPALHYKFEVLNRGGLTGILEKEIPFVKGIRKINDTGLMFINTGDTANFHLAPKHLEKLKHYLDILKTKIQYVLLDIPPLLEYAEGITLSKLCDGLILVIEAGETRWEVVQQARRLLERAQVDLIGGVLNRRKYYISNWAYKKL